MMDNQDAQSVTQEDREVAADIWRGYIAKVGEIIVERQMRAGGLDEGLPAILAAHRRASQPTSAEDAVDVKAERATFETWWRMWCPNIDMPSATSHIFDAWVARARSASRPTPDTQTAAIGAQKLLDVMNDAESRLGEAESLARLLSDQLDAANRQIAILSQPVAAPQAEAPQPEGGTDRLVTALTKVMPIRVQNGPDYAEVYFSDGSTHSTQAMTMNPDDWTAINEAFAALQPEKTNDQ